MSDTNREVVETRDNYRLVIVPQMYDTEEANPRNDGNLGIMACAHSRYTLGDQGANEVDEVLGAMRHFFDGRHPDPIPSHSFVRWLRMKYGATVVRPLYLLDHSGISISTGRFIGDAQGWDTSLVGLIFDTTESRKRTGVPIEKVEEALLAEVTEYDKYLRCEVYGYVVEQSETWHKEGSDETRTEWDEVESCWSFLGRDFAKEEGLLALSLYADSPNG